MEEQWKPNDNLRRIVCSACVYYDKYNVELLVLGPRHWDMTMNKNYNLISLAFRNTPEKSKFKQGFIDNFGTFWDRKGALVIARRMNQVVRELDYETEELYSEMLY